MMSRDNLLKTFVNLKKYGQEAITSFSGIDIGKSYINSSKVPNLQNGKICVPENIDKMLTEFGKINGELGKEVAYYLIGLDNSSNGNGNEVIITSLVYSTSESVAGDNKSCSHGKQMTDELNKQLNSLSGQNDIIVFQGHTHPPTPYSNDFSLLDLANIREHAFETNFQLGAFLVCPSQQDGSGPLTYRACFYDKGQDNFYKFPSFELAQNTGLLIDADTRILEE